MHIYMLYGNIYVIRVHVAQMHLNVASQRSSTHPHLPTANDRQLVTKHDETSGADRASPRWLDY